VIKQLTAILATHLHLKREVTEQFDDLGHVIVVFGEQLALRLRIKQVFPR